MGDLKDQSPLFPMLDLAGGVSLPIEHSSETVAGRPLRRKYLVNKLNHLNFSSGSVECEFRHVEFASVRTLRAVPEICKGARCDFRWINGQGSLDWMVEYRLTSLRLRDEEKTILIYPEEQSIGTAGVSILLPKTAISFENAHEKREPASGIKATVLQSGVRLQGELAGFSPYEMLITTPEIDESRWLDSTRRIELLLEAEDRLIYSESCHIDSTSNARGGRSLVLSIPQESVRRYPSRQYRSHRSELQTSPRCLFSHPLSGRSIERRLADLSGSGFSFRDQNRSVRLPVGLIIDDLTLYFAEYSSVCVRAQVIHRRANDDGAGIHYGLCILDVDPQDHLILLSLVHQAYNSYSTLCKKVDLDRLWRFFFDSGFIYPEKYVQLQKNKEEIRRSFERLYLERNNVARHFIYQREDQIQGHLSMVRYFERTWLLHHHASSSSHSENAGIHVLNQVGSYVNDSCRFARMNLDYLMCYYRPKNHFPKKVFGGLVEFVGNRKICSADEMAYCSLRPEEEDLDSDTLWSLDEPTEEDFIQLGHFYEEYSGGLLLEAMHLPPFADMRDSNARVQQAYADLGITREIVVRSLKHNGRLAAVFVINRSDPGINLSELTNSTLLFIMKPELLSKELLLRAFSSACRAGAKSRSPVLVFPAASADKLNVEYEKSYIAWIMNTVIGDTYFEHIQSILRTVQS